MNTRDVMRARWDQERVEELKKDFKKDKRYVVSVSTKFEGVFTDLVQEDGEWFAIFTQSGVTDRGKPSVRKVKVKNIVSYGMIKV